MLTLNYLNNFRDDKTMELRFEAWNTELKVMHRVGDDYGTTSYLDCINYLKQGQPVIIRQWTGLTDKNGKDIYEGDIVNHDMGNHSVTQIHGCWMFVWKPDHWVNAHWYMKESEVIGNIHQHPELMDRGNNND